MTHATHCTCNHTFIWGWPNHWAVIHQTREAVRRCRLHNHCAEDLSGNQKYYLCFSPPISYIIHQDNKSNTESIKQCEIINQLIKSNSWFRLSISISWFATSVYSLLWNSHTQTRLFHCVLFSSLFSQHLSDVWCVMCDCVIKWCVMCACVWYHRCTTSLGLRVSWGFLAIKYLGCVKKQTKRDCSRKTTLLPLS